MTTNQPPRRRPPREVLWKHLDEIEAGADPADVVFRPAVEEAASDLQNELGAYEGDLADIDLDARYALGWLHWYRHETPSAPDDGRDLDAAVHHLALCFLHGAEPLPEPLLPALADEVERDAVALLDEADEDEAAPESVRFATALWQRIVSATEDDDRAPWARRASNLGVALQLRYELDDDQGDLAAAIEAGAAAVDATPTGHPHRNVHLLNLSTALRWRFEDSGTTEHLRALSTVLCEAIATTPPGDRDGADAEFAEALNALVDHPARAEHLSRLSLAQRERYDHTGEEAALHAAVACADAAVAASTEDDPQLLPRLHNAGLQRLLRAQEMDSADDLEAALNTAREVVAGCGTREEPLRCAFLTTLASVLHTRFTRLGAAEDSDAAVAAAKEAEAASSPEHPDHAAVLTNLSDILRTRFEHTGALTDADGAVDAGERAVATARAGGPHGAADLANCLHNLSCARLARHGRTGAERDLDEAIARGQEAVDRIPSAHRELPRALTDLSLAHLRRFESTRDTADARAAVAAARDAVSATPGAHPDLAAHLSNLALALSWLCAATRDPADTADAVRVARKAAAATPEDHPHRTQTLSILGQALRSRFDLTGRLPHAEEALDALAAGARAEACSPRSRIDAARWAADLPLPSHTRLRARLLETAVDLLPAVVPRRLLRRDQHSLLGDFAGLAGEATALALTDEEERAGERGAAGPSGALRALRLLESGRAVLLSQALETRGDLGELRRHHPRLAARLDELRRLLDPAHAALPPAPAVREEFTETLARVRALAGFDSFLLPPGAEELADAAREGPVAVFNVGASRSDALLVTGAGVTSLPLPDLTQRAVVRQANAFHGALARIAHPDAAPDERLAAQHRLNEILAWLWDAAAEPVLRALGIGPRTEPADSPPPRVWWAPGGLLGTLPLHAAGYHREPDGTRPRRTVLDRAVSSYTPTVRALRHARELRSPGPAGRALVVAMPETPDADPLPHAADEARRITATLPGTTVLTSPGPVGPGAASAGPAGAGPQDGEPPTKQAVLERLPEHRLVHFACHATSEPADPARSRLLLLDHRTDPLTVADLDTVRLEGARLAYLSACRTALTESMDLVDESIHLTSAFQLAGFRHVVGTLWAVEDRFAADVAAAFYTELGSEPALETDRAARALHTATRALRDRMPRFPSLWAAHIHAGA